MTARGAHAPNQALAETAGKGWKCNELRDGWCWLRGDRKARILARCDSPDDFTLEVRDGDFFAHAGRFGSLSAAMAQAVRS